MDTTLLPKAAYRRLDLFPATVSDRQGAKRVVVTDSYVVILGESSTGPQIEEVRDLYDFEGSNKTGWKATLDTEDGEEMLIKRAQGCGCGSRLRGAKLYPGVPLRTK